MRLNTIFAACAIWAAGLFLCSPVLAATVFDEQFNGAALDPAWNIEYSGNIKAPYWDYSVSNGYLTVTNLYAVTYSSDPQLDHTSVVISQTFDEVSDFSFTSQLVWNQSNDRASDEFMFTLPGIVRIGYRDVWISDKGNFEIYPVGGTAYSTSHTFPYSGTANVEVTRINGTVNVYWNSTLYRTFTNTTPLSELQFLFDFKAVQSGSTKGFFGTQQVNYATITGDLVSPPVPEPLTLILVGIGIAGLLKKTVS